MCQTLFWNYSIRIFGSGDDYVYFNKPGYSDVQPKLETLDF